MKNYAEGANAICEKCGVPIIHRGEYWYDDRDGHLYCDEGRSFYRSFHTPIEKSTNFEILYEKLL